MSRSKRREALVLGTLSGALLGVASLPGPLGVLGFVALVPLLIAIDRGATVFTATLAGFLAGLLQFGIGFGFIPFASIGGGPALLAVYLLGILLLAAGTAGYAAALAWMRRYSRAFPLLAAPGGWIVLELLRSQSWIGIPWNHLAYGLAEHPVLIQGASLVGLYGISCWVASVNAGLVASRSLAPRHIAILAIALGTPLVPGLLPFPEAPASSLRVAAVQPDLSEQRRHHAEWFHPNLRHLLALTDEVIEEQPDLLVWPESAYERDLAPGGDAFLSAIGSGFGTSFVTGAWRIPHPGSALRRNAALVVDRQGNLVHVSDKVHPVPIFERAPSGEVSRMMARLGLWSGQFESGELADPIQIARETGTPVMVGVLVCIDVGYPDLAKRLRRRGARLLVIVSNEAGTGDWSARIHARIARFRAAEVRAPVVRVANAGPTRWIDARGRVVLDLAPGGPGAATQDLQLAGPPPPAVHLGDGQVVASALGLGLAAAGIRIRTRKRVSQRRRLKQPTEEI